MDDPLVRTVGIWIHGYVADFARVQDKFSTATALVTFERAHVRRFLFCGLFDEYLILTVLPSFYHGGIVVEPRM